MSLDWLPRQWPRVYPIQKFSHRFQLLNDYWGDIVGDDSGVYILVALHPNLPGDQRRVIGRLLADDGTGTLYLGKADRNHDNASGGLAGRLGRLANSILPGSKGRSHFNGKFRDFYANSLPAHTLGICWIHLAETKFQYASEQEHELMKHYTQAFGEAPPFNSQGFIA